MSVRLYHPLLSSRSTATPLGSVSASLVVLAIVASGAHASTATDSMSIARPSTDDSQFHVAPPSRGSSELTSLTVDTDLADVEAEASRILQGDLSSASAVAKFSQSPSSLEDANERSFDPLPSLAGSSPVAPRAAGITGADLTETIFALQSDSIASRSRGISGDEGGDSDGDSLFGKPSSAGRGARKTKKMFWEEAADADWTYAADPRMAAVLDAGPRAAGSADVFIPLPAAAWSALTVLGGASVMAGLRRLRRRAKQ